MLYEMHEFARLAMMPWRGAAQATRLIAGAPWNPIAYTPLGQQIAAATEVFERATRRYGKPEWDLPATEIDGIKVAVETVPVVKRIYCHLLHFKRDVERKDPRVLIVAPLSGHYATLLRGTVQAMLPDHEVYVTDWRDSRMIPVQADQFNLNDYIDYVIDFLHFLGPNTHVIAVCQPSVPVIAAVSVMSEWGDLCVPASITLMGGPIDTRENPTAVNTLAKDHGLDWFEKNVITKVPSPYPGAGRQVYPGFIQLTNFISMNLDKHMESFNELFDHLVQGDEEEADKRRAFYEEYLAVMDLPAEFYLQTIKTVFQDHDLPNGKMIHRWHPVRPAAIKRSAILCIEGELDDISGVGQTRAALDLATGLPPEMKKYHLQRNVGHYGIFNGGRWRREIAPVVKAFIREHDHTRRAKKARLVTVA